MGRIARSSALAAALALVSTQAPAAPQAATPPSAAQAKQAFFYFRVLISAIQSDKVEVPVKDALMGCIYTNSLGKISDAMDKVFAANPGKLDKTKPNDALQVMAGICGFRPAKSAAPTPAPKKK